MWIIAIYFLKSNLELFKASIVAEKEGKIPAFNKVLSKNARMFLLNLNENGDNFESSKLNLTKLMNTNPLFILTVKFWSPIYKPKI